VQRSIEIQIQKVNVASAKADPVPSNTAHSAASPQADQETDVPGQMTSP